MTAALWKEPALTLMTRWSESVLTKHGVRLKRKRGVINVDKTPSTPIMCVHDEKEIGLCRHKETGKYWVPRKFATAKDTYRFSFLKILIFLDQNSPIVIDYIVYTRL